MKGVLAATATVLVAVTAAVVAAQAPVVNAKVETRSVTQGLAREIQTVVDRGQTLWFGYRVPKLMPANGTVRSTEWCCGRCRLEPPTEVVVLARVEARSLVELRAIGVDCDLDASGMPLVWFEGVNGNDSVAWLASLVTGTPANTRDRMPERAISAIAQHAAPAAADPLVRFARQAATPQLRGQALSSLAMRGAAQALPTINAALDQDPDTQVKRRAVQSLAQMPRGEGIPRLMEIARTHANTEIRRQAMQALGQSRDPRAVDFFEQILVK